MGRCRALILQARGPNENHHARVWLIASPSCLDRCASCTSLRLSTRPEGDRSLPPLVYAEHSVDLELMSRSFLPIWVRPADGRHFIRKPKSK